MPPAALLPSTSMLIILVFMKGISIIHDETRMKRYVQIDWI